MTEANRLRAHRSRLAAGDVRAPVVRLGVAHAHVVVGNLVQPTPRDAVGPAEAVLQRVFAAVAASVSSRATRAARISRPACLRARRPRPRSRASAGDVRDSASGRSRSPAPPSIAAAPSRWGGPTAGRCRIRWSTGRRAPAAAATRCAPGLCLLRLATPTNSGTTLAAVRQPRRSPGASRSRSRRPASGPSSRRSIAALRASRPLLERARAAASSPLLGSARRSSSPACGGRR